MIKIVQTNNKNNILSFFPLGRRKMGFYILLLGFTTLAFSQKKAVKDTLEISTESKNLIRKGNKLYEQGQYVSAQEAYKEAITINPNYDKANYNYGNTQFLQNKIKEAKEQYELASKITKDPFVKADAQHNLGNVAMKDKKYAEAVNAYKEALRKNPNDDETRYNLALAQKLLKEQQKKNDKNKDKKDDKKDKKDDKKDKNKKDDKQDKKDNKDKDKKEDKDKKKGDDQKDKQDQNKDKKDDGKDKNDKDKKEQQQPKPQPTKLSPEQVKKLLEDMNKEENKTQKKINAKKARGRKVKQDKDW